MRRGALLILAVLLAAGCGGSVLPPRSNAADAELAELKQRLLDLQRRAAVQQVERARLRERVADWSRLGFSMRRARLLAIWYWA